MTTESDVKIARYNTIVKEADDFGRTIGVRRLKPSEQTKLIGMTSDVTGSDDFKNAEDGTTVQVSYRLPLLIAAAVCLIDDVPISFPRNRGELDAIYDRLDVEGMAAASKAMVKLTSSGGDPITKDEAKN